MNEFVVWGHPGELTGTTLDHFSAIEHMVKKMIDFGSHLGFILAPFWEPSWLQNRYKNLSKKRMKKGRREKSREVPTNLGLWDNNDLLENALLWGPTPHFTAIFMGFGTILGPKNGCPIMLGPSILGPQKWTSGLVGLNRSSGSFFETFDGTKPHKSNCK